MLAFRVAAEMEYVHTKNLIFPINVAYLDFRSCSVIVALYIFLSSFGLSATGEVIVHIWDI